jgi:hypothetical protein
MTTAQGRSGVLRRMYLVALAMFLVTVAIGILNGLDVVDFTHDQLLTHVHSGTLGWISLALVASAMWLTRAVDARLAVALIVLIPIYVAAFFTGSLPARAVTGTALLVAIVAVLVWIWGRARTDRSFPVLALALGFTIFAWGAIVGVLLQVQMASTTQIFPLSGDIVGAHAGAMVFGYLILVAMGLLEWQLMGATARTRGALVQAGALFAGGAVISLGLLFLGQDAAPVAMLDLVLELVAIVIFAVRVLPSALAVGWGRATGKRHIAASAVFVPIALAAFLYVIVTFITAGPQGVTGRMLEASDHAAFIGVISNLVFGLIATATRDRGEDLGIAGQVGFWLMNLGLLVFLTGLLTDSDQIIRVGAPSMGVGILVVMGISAMRLLGSSAAERLPAEA